MSSLAKVPPVNDVPEPATICPNPIGRVTGIPAPPPAIGVCSNRKPEYFPAAIVAALKGEAGSMAPTKEPGAKLSRPGAVPVLWSSRKKPVGPTARVVGSLERGKPLLGFASVLTLGAAAMEARLLLTLQVPEKA